MEVINYTDFRKDLSNVLNRVISDRNPTVITRQNSEPTVLISLKDFNAYEETAYLLKNPNNAEVLRRSIADAKAGKLTKHELIEVD